MQTTSVTRLDLPAVQCQVDGVELFVAFALIHDDIMDDSASRRGRPAVHRVMRARLGAGERTERLGAGGALLVGNLALMWAQELLHTTPLTPAGGGWSMGCTTRCWKR
jgi:geranylgeranyl pyrophosphate synthase